MENLGRVAFIGAGNMASALIAGLLRAGISQPEQLIAHDIRSEALIALRARHAIRTAATVQEALAESEIVLLCVKPQTLAEVLSAVADRLGAALVISVAAGIPTAVIEAQLPRGTRVVRAMPNTPALVGQGATGLAAGSEASVSDLERARRLFDSVGTTLTVDEPELDAVTGVSGSGPAYVFRFVEALTTAAQAVGLSHDAAVMLARQTLVGAATLLNQSDEPAAVLRERVTSKGGTTAAGLAALETAGLEAAVVACVRAATVRATELGQAARADLEPG